MRSILILILSLCLSWNEKCRSGNIGELSGAAFPRGLCSLGVFIIAYLVGSTPLNHQTTRCLSAFHYTYLIDRIMGGCDVSLVILDWKIFIR